MLPKGCEALLPANPVPFCKYDDEAGGALANMLELNTLYNVRVLTRIPTYMKYSTIFVQYIRQYLKYLDRKHSTNCKK